MKRATSIKLSLLVGFARVRMVWRDIKPNVEFKAALWLFVVIAMAVAMLGLFSGFVAR